MQSQKMRDCVRLTVYLPKYARLHSVWGNSVLFGIPGSLALVHDMNSKMAHRFALGGTFMEPG